MGLHNLFLFLPFVLVIGTYFSWRNRNDNALDFAVEISGSLNAEVGAQKSVLRDDEFDWGKSLSWHDCYDGFQCARFKVPINYSEPEGRPAILALIRLEASDSDDYRGPILFNPGGPGGSGVEFVLKRGRNLSTILGPGFDIVGFDPRGVSRSLPQVSFYNSRVERKIWNFKLVQELNYSNHGLADTWGKALVTGHLAAERDLGKDVLAHINTGNTARDMLSITEAHGFEKLKYWGFSYGTILGATFAAIFPDKVERLVIDGVVDAVEYYGTKWDPSLRDTSATLQDFFNFCHAAGPSKCAFYAPSPSQIEQNLFDLYSPLKEKPIPVRTDKSYGLVDYARLADLKQGNGTKLFMMQEEDPFQCACSPDMFGRNIGEASNAIMCTDGKPIPGSYEDVVKYHEDALEFSKWSSVWTGVKESVFFSRFHEMSKVFPGSVVLSQDSPGHGSISAPSPCTQSYVAAYFVNGTLPKPGTWCPVIGTPFNQDDALKELDLLSLGHTDNQEITSLNDGQQRTFSFASSLSSSSLFSENGELEFLRAVFDMSRDSINLPTRSRLPLHV
ncbi:alpha/beta-hydrolase [Dendrothele bispora CBS 962.96]|uniref:Alpha/beta-hydrolase n=1 Tax=Dendrothele bispora (strain CBS 962.96) TaxID=1314807 RepID=A0A4S8L8Q4_DENBC|nr:alpha/beta-hydrolase [Dendrothele bispora CBS 962.96]